MGDHDTGHMTSASDMTGLYPGDITQSRDGHMIFSSTTIKQENGGPGHLNKSACTGTFSSIVLVTAHDYLESGVWG